jgi:SRSO17 transposase
MTQENQAHLFDGATLGTEDRGDIVIRNAAGDLLYRFVPNVKCQSQSLSEVMLVAHANAQAFARRDNKKIPDAPAFQAKALLLELKGLVSRLWDGFHTHRDDEARALHVALEDADDLVKKAVPLIDALNTSPN